MIHGAADFAGDPYLEGRMRRFISTCFSPEEVGVLGLNKTGVTQEAKGTEPSSFESIHVQQLLLWTKHVLGGTDGRLQEPQLDRRSESTNNSVAGG